MKIRDGKLVIGEIDDGYREVPLIGQAALVMRPVESIDAHAAQVAVAATVAALDYGGEAAIRYGLGLVGQWTGMDANRRAGIMYAISLAELGVRVISEFRNIEAPDGSPAEVTREALFQLFRVPQIATRFETVAFSILREAAAEGNGSVPSPNGGGEAGSPTAPTVGAPASPAPRADAA